MYFSAVMLLLSIFFCHICVWNTVAYAASILSNNIPRWTGSHNRHEGQFCSDDSDCVVPLVCYRSPTISSPEGGVISALTPRIAEIVHVGFNTLMQGSVCRRLEHYSVAAKIVADANELKQAEQVADEVKRSPNLFLESLIDQKRQQQPEFVPNAVVCVNPQKSALVGSSIFVSVAGPKNELFEASPGIAFTVLEARQQRKVAESFSFLCDTAGIYTLAFRVLPAGSEFVVGPSSSSTVCLMTVDCVINQPDINTRDINTAISNDTEVAGGEAEEDSDVIECVQFKSFMGVGRSISVPLNESLFHIKSRRHGETQRVVTHFEVSSAPSSLGQILQVGSGPVFTHRCERQGLVEILVAIISAKNSAEDIHTTLCPLSIECYVNEPPEITCEDPTPVIVGNREDKLLALISGGGQTSQFYAISDRDNDVLEDMETRKNLETVEHQCDTKPQVVTRKVEISAVDTYHATTVTCEVIFAGTCYPQAKVILTDS